MFGRRRGHGIIRVMSVTVRLLMTLALATLSQAQNCSNPDWAGTHHFLISGSAPDASSIRRPLARLGKFVADGSGNLTGESTDSVNGIVGTSSITGTYTVTGDCGGSQTLTFTPRNASPATLSISAFQLVDGAQQAITASSDVRVIVTGRMHRAAAVGASQCGNGSLLGNYGFEGFGPAIGSAPPYSSNGGIVFDGQGSLTYKLAHNDGTSGTTSMTGNGTYSIAADCSGTAAFELSGGGTANYTVAVVEGGNILFMQTDPGTLFYGTGQPQSRPMILPQFAFGGGWYSALYFDNGTDAATSFTRRAERLWLNDRLRGDGGHAGLRLRRRRSLQRTAGNRQFAASTLPGHPQAP